jgi:hypothetical protein
VASAIRWPHSCGGPVYEPNVSHAPGSPCSNPVVITPGATPANLIVMEPGGYRFGDYWRLGLPLLALFGVVAIGLVPVFWPL